MGRVRVASYPSVVPHGRLRSVLALLGRVVLGPRSEDGRPVAENPRRLHRHRFRWASDDSFSGSSHYACRCGEIRPGL